MPDPVSPTRFSQHPWVWCEARDLRPGDRIAFTDDEPPTWLTVGMTNAYLLTGTQLCVDVDTGVDGDGVRTLDATDTVALCITDEAAQFSSMIGCWPPVGKDREFDMLGLIYDLVKIRVQHAPPGDADNDRWRSVLSLAAHGLGIRERWLVSAPDSTETEGPDAIPIPAPPHPTTTVLISVDVEHPTGVDPGRVREIVDSYVEHGTMRDGLETAFDDLVTELCDGMDDEQLDNGGAQIILGASVVKDEP